MQNTHWMNPPLFVYAQSVQMKLVQNKVIFNIYQTPAHTPQCRWTSSWAYWNFRIRSPCACCSTNVESDWRSRANLDSTRPRPQSVPVCDHTSEQHEVDCDWLTRDTDLHRYACVCVCVSPYQCARSNGHSNVPNSSFAHCWTSCAATFSHLCAHRNLPNPLANSRSTVIKQIFKLTKIQINLHWSCAGNASKCLHHATKRHCVRFECQRCCFTRMDTDWSQTAHIMC